ncbi:5-formyltetrahydrofolate cyclo-ligase [Candidatus Enterovibrio escicola]|nr:5-formyltetrahydrofolate cyclo-ligase [Candidatus Enterovibrio escacola]
MHDKITLSAQRIELRKLIRTKRRALSIEKQRVAACELLTHFQNFEVVRCANYIAFYLSVDGELGTQPLIQYCWRQGKAVYLPVIHPFSNGNLLFLHYCPNTDLIPNRYGILEPKFNVSEVLSVSKLDIICTPLVAFDGSGQRLGMGGGYYDRTLASWWNMGAGPHALGLAYDFQQVEILPVEAWDVPLSSILTPSRVWEWNR